MTTDAPDPPKRKRGRPRKVRVPDPALLEAASAELAERSLYEFVQQAWPIVEPATVFKPNWHLECICEHLEAVYRLEISNLVINLPPRHSKSLLVSVFWFCWVWVREPATRWLYASHAEGLSTRDAVKARNIIRHPWYQERWGGRFRIKPDEDSKVRFVNNHAGHRISTSVGGRGTGEGGDFIVGDDVHKINEVESDSIRNMVISWWDSVMGTRGNDPKTTRRVIVMQRLDERDLTAHVLAQELGYEALVIPGRHEEGRIVYSLPEGVSASQYRRMAESGVIIPTSLQMARPELRDPRTRNGELLWPDHFGPREMRALELTLGTFGVAGQIQQRPAPAGGGIINSSYFQYFTEELITQDDKQTLVYVLHRRDGTQRHVPASACRLFQTADTAMCAGQDNDYTAIGTYAQTPENDLLVLHMYRDRLEVPHQMGALMAQRMRWPGLLFQAVENKQSGTGLIQTGRLKGVPFRVLKADGDKKQRGAAVSIMYENLMVYHRAGEEWLVDFEKEIIAVPNSAFDDQYDSLAYAGILVTTDALLAMTNGVEDLLAYPTADDARQVAERAGMSEEHYDLLYDGWGDDDVLLPERREARRSGYDGRLAEYGL